MGGHCGVRAVACYVTCLLLSLLCVFIFLVITSVVEIWAFLCVGPFKPHTEKIFGLGLFLFFFF